jgi:hypothetical protein
VRGCRQCEEYEGVNVKQHGNIDIGLPAGIERYLFALVLFLAILWLIINAFSTGQYELVAAAVALPFSAILVGKLRWLVVVTLGLFLSRLYVPALPRSMELYHAFALFVLPLLGAAYCVRPPEITAPLYLKVLAVAFLGIIGITIYARGFGMAFTGGTSWGGAAYVYMTLAIMLLLFSDAVVLTQNHWKWLFILLFGGACIVALASLVYFVSKGKITAPYSFIHVGESWMQRNLNTLLSESEHVFRIKSAKKMFYLLVLSLILVEYKGSRKLAILACALVAVGGIGISGHRGAVISFVVFLLCYVTFQNRRFPVRPLSFILFGSAVLMTVFANWGSHFPLAVQRAFSWLPFADISYLAEKSAAGTLRRFDLWRELITDYVPRYWLIGRGFAFSTRDLFSVSAAHSAIESFKVTNNYHNGLLVLLVNLGIGGMFFGYALLVGGALRHYRLLKTEWVNNALSRYHKVMLALFITSIITQTAVGCGDWITRPLIFLVILEGLYRTNRWELSRNGTVNNAESSVKGADA